MKRLLTILFIAIYSTAVAQNGKISGTISDSATGKPITGVVALVEGSNSYSVSNKDGEFEINNAPTGFHRISFQILGYENSQTEPILITVADPKKIEVALTPQAITVGEVKVVGGALRAIDSPPVGLRTINLREIEKTPGGNRDISKVVQNTPGVVATSISRNDLIVRGGGPNENKFYLDRIEIPLLNHFQTQGASGGNASQINSDLLRGATLYTSAFPASRGGALSSVLDLRLKEGNFDSFKARLSAGASDAAISIDTPLSSKISLIASYRISYLKTLFSIIDLPFLPTYQDSQIKAVYKISKRDKITLLALGSYDINRLNNSMEELTPDREQILNYLPENDQWSYVVGGVYTHITQKGVLDFILSHDRLNNKLNKWQDNDKSKEKTLSYNSNEKTIRNRVQYSQKIGNIASFNGGASFEHGNYDVTSSQMLYFDNIPYLEQYNSRLNINRYALYGSFFATFFNKKLEATLSARVDGNDYSSEMSNPLKQFSPRLSMSWKFSDKWALNGNVGRYFQEPGYGVMGYRNSDNIVVNRDRLKYINSFQATAGVTFQSGKNQKITSELFWKGYGDYPMSLVDSTAIGSNSSDVFAVGSEPAASIGKVRAYGFELSYKNEDVFGAIVDASYTYYRSEYRKLGRDLQPSRTYNPTNWDYRHILNIVASKNFGKGWDVGMRWRIAGGAPSTPYDIVTSAEVDSWNSNNKPVLDYSLVNSTRLEPFHQLDLRVDKSWYLNRWTIALYLDIQNLYNYKSYDKDIYLPLSDESGNYIVDPNNPNSYILESYPNSIGGTILPTFGIIIEF